jgi:hypothetical protein
MNVRRARLVQFLQAVGLGGVVAALLEGDNPLPFLGAQALLFAAPVIDPFLTGAAGQGPSTQALADWLENPAAREALVRELKTGTRPPGTPPQAETK